MRTTTFQTKRLLGVTVSALALLLTAACSDGDDRSADDVATIDGDTGSTDDTSDSDTEGGGRGGNPEAEAAFQDAMLEFAQCMRDQGVDMPDPQFDEDGGGLIIGGGPQGGGDGPPSDAEIEEMEAAQQACEPILEEARASMPEPDPEEVAEMQDQALAFAECMREHGIDMPDPEFTEDGGILQRVGEAGGAPEFTDEEFEQASEECDAEGGFGPGPGARGESGDAGDADDGGDTGSDDDAGSEG